ncbi:MAG: hypothetical protein E6I74_01550 [Chloroflexi bacterium]|nr:MAG: hypothetical protein E6I74_01550 [Chloroflexota bacterium]
MLQKLSVIVLAVALSACGTRASNGEQLTVNGQAVSLSLYHALVAAEEQRVERSGAEISSQTPAGRRKKASIEASVIREVTRDAIIGQLAQARGIRLTAAELRQRVSAAEQAFGGAGPFEEALQQAGLSRMEFATIVRFRILESHLSEIATGGSAGIDGAVLKAHVVITLGPCTGGAAYPDCLSAGS